MHSKQNKFKNTEKTYQNAAMALNHTMLMECVRTVTTPKAELRELISVNIKKECSTPKVYAKTAT